MANPRKTFPNDRVGRETLTAIMVDGGFYRHQAYDLFGDKTPEQRAVELFTYCMRHIAHNHSNLYRIFYYDCPPSTKTVFHPLLRKTINLGKTEQYRWSERFFEELAFKRKVALRRGEELSTGGGYRLHPDKLKKLCAGTMSVDEIQESDLTLEITQKGVDLRLGIDIADIANRGLVNQIVMIAGDSDFVPAAKYARRSGIDFILDPMYSHITKSLNEHVDGLYSPVKAPPANSQDALHVSNLGASKRGSR